MAFTERSITPRGILTARPLTVLAALAYLLALTSPAWGLSWSGVSLIPWAAFITVLLGAATYRLLGPSRSYPFTDISFIIPMVIAVNVFTMLLGQEGEWLRPMNFLLLALCAIYYPLRFNLAVAGLVLLLDASYVFLGSSSGGVGRVVNLMVYAAWLAAIPLILGRLFQSEYRKKELVKSDLKRLREGAGTLESASPGDAGVSGMSEGYREIARVDAFLEMERAIGGLLDTLDASLMADGATLLMPTDDGSFAPRIFRGALGPDPDASVREGEGLVGWVMKEKKPITVGSNASGLGYMSDEAGVNSFAAVPVLDGDSLLGVLAVVSTDTDAFADEERAALEGFAGNALYLIQNARRLHATTRHARAIGALFGVSREISSSLDIGFIVDKLADFSEEILSYDFMTFWLVNAGGRASLKFARGYDGFDHHDVKDGPVELEGSFLKYIAESGVVSFTDYESTKERLPLFPIKDLNVKSRSFLGLPLKDGDTLLGIITYGNRRPGAISPYQQHTLQVIANQVSAAIVNAKLHHAIRLMATTDGLTGLINHRHFQERADEAFTRASRYPEEVSILLFDIDHFKNVNDTFGHPVGDAVLKKVADILRETVREVDIPARYGGEEFTVIMPNTGEEGAFKMAERIRKTIEKTKFVFEDKQVPVTVSIGTSGFPADGRDKKTVINNADQALYHSKRSGRNRCTRFSELPPEQE